MECDVLHSGKRWFEDPDDGGGKFLPIFRLLPKYKVSQFGKCAHSLTIFICRSPNTRYFSFIH